MSEFNVVIPEEKFDLLEFTTDELPGIAVINSSLKVFEPKTVFAWHCSVNISLEDLIDNGMPSKEEVAIIDQFGDFLDESIKGDADKPNALFLARITWNGTRELVWRVYDPEIANEFLTTLIDEDDNPREFDYSITHDEEWELTEWHLTDW